MKGIRYKLLLFLTQVKTAVDRDSGIMYALKVIDASKINGKEEMLRNEIAIQRKSQHPNLVQLLHDFHSPTEIFLVMELITGGDLFDLIAENVRFEEEVSLFHQIILGCLLRGSD